MGPLLFDSSVYISALRGVEEALLSLRRIEQTDTVWLSSVVLEELYAGARPSDRYVMEGLERDFGKARRILAPNLSDWTQTGKVLARLGAEYGYEQIGRGRLTNDALIAISAGRMGIKVITASARDYERLAKFNPFGWSIF